MIDILGLLTVFFIDEPRRAISNYGVRIFIESQRPDNAGRGKVVATAGGYFDSDSYPDKLVVYSYGKTSTPDEQEHGSYAVVFFTEDFTTSAILFIPATDIIPESVREYSSRGGELIIKGKRRLPDDDECCPSAMASIALRVVNREVVVLKGEQSE